MTKYVKRTTQPEKTNQYYNSRLNPFVSAGYGMFQNNGNCTAYAFGRRYEIEGVRPKLSTRNAENWFGNTTDGYKRGQTPKVGAVICWRKGKAGNSGDGAGHVGIVEEVKSNGDILISNSGWKQFIFKTKLVTKASGYMTGLSSAYKFQGFIYAPIEYEVEEPKAAAYTKGTYITLENMKVRTGAGTNHKQKKVKELTADGKKNATSQSLNAYAVYKKGTVFTALEIINENGVWAKSPSGYICIKGASGKVYCKKK